MTDRTPYTIKFNMFALHWQLEIFKGKAIEWSRIAEATDLHSNTLSNLSNNRTRRVDLKTLEKLLSYFQSAVLEIKTGDLFKVTKEA